MTSRITHTAVNLVAQCCSGGLGYWPSGSRTSPLQTDAGAGVAPSSTARISCCSRVGPAPCGVCAALRDLVAHQLRTLGWIPRIGPTHATEMQNHPRNNQKKVSGHDYEEPSQAVEDLPFVDLSGSREKETEHSGNPWAPQLLRCWQRCVRGGELKLSYGGAALRWFSTTGACFSSVRNLVPTIGTHRECHVYILCFEVKCARRGRAFRHRPHLQPQRLYSLVARLVAPDGMAFAGNLYAPTL
jgi:hypothetical protein